MLVSEADVPLSFVSTSKRKQLLRDAIFSKHERIPETLGLEKCLLRQHPGRRTLDDYSVISLVNLPCTIYIANRDLLVNQLTAKHVKEALVILAVLCHCHRRTQTVTHLLSLEFFHAFDTGGLEQGNKEMNIDWFIPRPCHQLGLLRPMLVRFTASSQCA